MTTKTTKKKKWTAKNSGIKWHQFSPGEVDRAMAEAERLGVKPSVVARPKDVVAPKNYYGRAVAKRAKTTPIKKKATKKSTTKKTYTAKEKKVLEQKGIENLYGGLGKSQAKAQEKKKR